MFGKKKSAAADAEAEFYRLASIALGYAADPTPETQETAVSMLNSLGVAPEHLTALCTELRPDLLDGFGVPQLFELARTPEPEIDGLHLPMGTDIARDWPRIVAACRQHLGAEPDRLVRVGERWVVQPRVETAWVLAADVRPTDGERVAAQAAAQGLLLTRFDAFGRDARVARVDEDTRRITAYVAAFLGVRPYEIGVVLAWDGADIAHVVITSMPAMGGGEKRVRMARELVLGLPRGGSGWTVRDLPQQQAMVLTYGVPAVLPGLVPLAGLLPERIDASEWSQLPLGLGVDGEQVCLDLRLGPHALLVGPTGSGKSVALVSLVSQALSRGMDVALVDVVKMGADFVQLKPFCAGWADGMSEAQALIEAIYRIVEERRLLCRDFGVPFWEDLPADVRAEKNIRPLLLVIDEYVSTVIPRTVSKALPKDSPLVAEAEAANAAKAVISEYVGRIAREARFVGVHLALACQRPDAVFLSGELRSNLTSAVQLVKPGSMPSRDALAMVFTADQVEAAQTTLAGLDDGHSRGLGAIGAEGGGVHGVRVAYAPTGQAAAALTEIGVPEATPIAVRVTHEQSQQQPVTFNPFGGDEPAPEPVTIVDSSFTLPDDDSGLWS